MSTVTIGSSAERMVDMDNKECCFCGCEIDGFGNNPWPLKVDRDARCCDYCNATIVFPARLERLMEDNDEQ